MMLMYCPECQDVIKISKVEHRSCYCGKASGRFDMDGNVTVLFGEAVPLRISTNSLKEAVDRRSIRNKERKEVSRSNVTIDIDDETSEVTIHILGEGLALQVAHDWITLLRQHGFDVDIEQQPQTIN